MEATKATKGADGRRGGDRKKSVSKQLKPASNSPSSVSLVSLKKDATPNIAVPALPFTSSRSSNTSPPG
ncbi:hypothetical protein FF1_014159 [Malus domestica]|uniref:Uncharacterized protein n=1 Tax=Malus domestica TaxID=3750 RepID=A0A498I0U4_MALDO|nr:hypothetical protein DVH24_019407 [Malus domestica]